MTDASVMARSEVDDVLAKLPDDLRDTMIDLVGAPPDVVVAVFQLLPDDQRDAAFDTGLAEGKILDTKTGLRDLRPTPTAIDLISTLARYVPPAADTSVSVDDLHARAEHLARQLADSASSATVSAASSSA